MKSIYNYIISTKNRYNNSIDVDDQELIVNSEITERDAQFVNRIGTVLSIPVHGGYDVKEGDEVIVHHNVFRVFYDSNQFERNSSSFLGENKFLAYPDQVYGYRRGGDWMATEGYCFVEPVFNEDSWSVATKKGLTGIVAFGDSKSPAEGTQVGFTPDSEYEFNIDGKLLYRILSKQITHEYTKRQAEGSSEVFG